MTSPNFCLLFWGKKNSMADYGDVQETFISFYLMFTDRQSVSSHVVLCNNPPNQAMTKIITAQRTQTLDQHHNRHKYMSASTFPHLALLSHHQVSDPTQTGTLCREWEPDKWRMVSSKTKTAWIWWLIRRSKMALLTRPTKTARGCFKCLLHNTPLAIVLIVISGNRAVNIGSLDRILKSEVMRHVRFDNFVS